MSEITRYPLCWPDDVPRTPPYNRKRPAFLERSVTSAIVGVISEINRLNHRVWNFNDPSVIISSNLKPRNAATFAALQNAYDQAMARFRG